MAGETAQEKHPGESARPSRRHRPIFSVRPVDIPLPPAFHKVNPISPPHSL
jgi:hypothetical protein